MAQHFLLSAKARTLSLAQVLRLSDDQAFETFKAMRWASTDGEPVCPKCGCLGAYLFKDGRLWRCKECRSKFSVTSGTIFASRKLSHRDYLAAVAIFVNGAKGYSALQLSRDLNVQYKTAFVLAHKLREALGTEFEGRELSGEVEVDGAYVGGHVRQENQKADRKDRRKVGNQNGKRQSLVIMRERWGRSVPIVAESELQAVPLIVQRVAPKSTVYADEAPGWNTLHAWFDTKRINHQKAFAMDGACTNWAESFFSRMRRAELGIHHRISGQYLQAYANELAWREDNRRVDNGTQYVNALKAALGSPVSRQWKAYWQRAKAA